MRLKSFNDIRGIWRSGQITGKLLNEIAGEIHPGQTTAALDDYAAKFIGGHGATAAFLGYNGFPGSICTSINDQVVHGIPGDRELAAGDLLSIDVGVVLEGYVSDAARTYVVGEGETGPDVERLLAGTRESLAAGIEAIEPGEPLRLVSRAIEQVLKGARLGVIRELTGHGVGFALHEEPTVCNYDPGQRLPLVSEGLVIAIEPMATLGSAGVILAADNWTYLTADGSLAAHYEHTVACWDGHGFILTDPADEQAVQAFGRAA
ncbi:MAG TPA: type I methionyl aminopeptidase [Firmicutes bacterium]|nr:type I methionyl aminopeptidase [Bacillota bacterium]